MALQPKAAPETQNTRLRIVERAFADLHWLGYRVRSVSAIREVHVRTLLNSWHNDGVSVGTLQKRLQILGWFCNAIGKGGLTRPLPHYLPDLTYQMPWLDTNATEESKLPVSVDVDLKTLWFLEWLRARTGITREDCLRVTGIELALQHWSTLEKSSKPARAVALPPQDVSIAISAAQHIQTMHGSSAASLGWSGRYRREDCPHLRADIARWKRLSHGAPRKFGKSPSI
ncbi:MAG: phage integrase N-terminal domain-containing protein [Casimicrobium sp.]